MVHRPSPLAVTVMCWQEGLNLTMCSLHSIKSTEIRVVKMFSAKASRDVGMVQCISERHMCLHRKADWWNIYMFHAITLVNIFLLQDTLDTFSPSRGVATIEATEAVASSKNGNLTKMKMA